MQIGLAIFTFIVTSGVLSLFWEVFRREEPSLRKFDDKIVLFIFLFSGILAILVGGQFFRNWYIYPLAAIGGTICIIALAIGVIKLFSLLLKRAERRFGRATSLDKKQEYLEKLLKKNEINSIRIDEIPLLIFAVKNNDIDFVRVLITKYKANVNIFDNFTEEYYLNNLEEYLLNPLSVNCPGCTPLQQAIKLGNVDMVKLLLNNGADVKGKYCIQQAAYCGNIAVIKLLLEAGANINDSVECGLTRNTPLACAKAKGNGEVIKFLLESGAKE